MVAPVVELICAGGFRLITTENTLSKASGLINADSVKDCDGYILSLLLDALRRDDMRLIVPDNFSEWPLLAAEARRLGLNHIAEAACKSTITISCQAALSTGRLNPEVTFRKIVRLIVCGRVNNCRTVFGEALNECRDGGADFEEDRYTSRFFLKHNNMEKAFDRLAEKGYYLSQANTFSPALMSSHTTEEAQFIHHTQYVFTKDSAYVPCRGGPQGLF